MRRAIQSKDIMLNVLSDLAENAKALVIINHGFAEYGGRYDYVAQYLKQEAFSVYRYDLRGHGESSGKKGHIDAYQDFIDDCQVIVELARTENPDLPIFMLGHSMGGLVSVLYALQYPDTLSGQILVGPALYRLPQVSGVKYYGIKAMTSLLPKMMIKNPVNEGLCGDRDVVEAYMNDENILKKASFRMMNQFLISGADKIKAEEKNYQYPVLILHGEKDSIVPVSISASFYQHIASSDKTRIVYPGLYHEILNEKVKDEILSTVTGWLDKHSKKSLSIIDA